ncbi:Hypothetical protein GLP15_3608 [Giardia lamblia P15]|uniref:Uncharacterized protein n=1 Tax=Giardia intestinalis (strain P15) TaxID=658858 RepID=E1EX94_GIAIA|nr:Hypothetical protein GLP15_3608 [Giardia lamblia P15]
MHALFRVQEYEGGASVPSDEAIVFSTDNLITVGDSKTVYYDREQAYNPRVVLTRKAIYFFSQQSPEHNLYMDLIDIESYKTGAPQKNALTIEITPTSSDKNDKSNNNLVTTVGDQVIRITFTNASKKHQTDLRTIKEDHDLLLASLTGLLEARQMTVSVMNFEPPKPVQESKPTPVEAVGESNSISPQIICDDQEGSSVMQTRDTFASSNNDMLSVAIFAPREPSVCKQKDQSENQSPSPIQSADYPVIAQPDYDYASDQTSLPSTLLSEDCLKEFSKPLTFDRLRKPNELLISINKLMLLFLKASNEIDCKITPTVSSILEEEVNNLKSVEASSLQTLLPSAEEFFTDNDHKDSLEEILGIPHVTNTALIELKGKSPAYIMSSYIDSYASSYNSMTSIEAPNFPLQMYIAGLQNVNIPLNLSKCSLTVETITRSLPSLLLNYSLTSPFHSVAKFKVIPADEIFSLLNHARPMYPVAVNTFYKAVKLAEDECKKGTSEKIPYHRFPMFVPWRINNTWYFVEKAVRLTNVIHFIVINVLYNAWTKVRAENPQPNKPHPCVTADELTARFGLALATSSDLLDFMVKQRLLVVDIHTSKRYYLNLITKHYRCLQDSASKISRITA